MMKKIIIMIMMATSTLAVSQSKIAMSIYQDASFGLLDVLARVDLQDRQGKVGFYSFALEVEYAKIKTRYYRYSLNLGYTFNKLILKNAETGFSVGYGFIDRNQRSFLGFNANTFIKYNLNNNIKLCLLAQVLDRKDIGKIQPSGFVGFEINLN